MKPFTLMQAHVNKIYRIKDVLGEGNAKRRLLDMGFTPGGEVYVAGIAPFGGTILVCLRGFSVALREDAAERIELEVDLGV